MRLTILGWFSLALIVGCSSETETPELSDYAGAAEFGSFCERLPRAQWAMHERHPASNAWFEVYDLQDGVFAIYEPFQWQEVISYLVVGDDAALLFDTGNGIGDIKAVVDQLTSQRIIVVNSHSHFDHVGGNHQFADIRSISTDFSLERARGLENADIKLEVSRQARCKDLPNGVTAHTHRSRPYEISAALKDGDVIELGGRQLEILAIPGHTSDSIALLERETGFLWTGDSFYEGPIWLYSPETDLAAYANSMERLAALVPNLTSVFPAHNSAPAKPERLQELMAAIQQIQRGGLEGTVVSEDQVEYSFENFSILLRQGGGFDVID